MTSPTALCTLLACAIVCLTRTCEGEIPQQLCAVTNADPNECRYGTYRDPCRMLVCKKGPGKRCGGPADILGKCGEGMRCRCEHCSGCSIDTFECDMLNDILCRESVTPKLPNRL